MFSNDFLNWSVFLAVNGLVLFSSFCLAGYLNRRNNDFSLNLIAAALIYFSQITASILFLGVVARYLNAFSLLATHAVVSGLLVFYFQKYRPPFLHPLRRFTRELMSQKDVTLYLVLFLFAAQAAILLVKISLLPPHIWDVFSYHLDPAVEWFQQGKIPAVIDTPVNRINSQTLGLTILNYWFFVFFEDSFLVELPQYLWALLLLPVAYTIMRKSGVSTNWAVKFSILIFFLPIILMQSITVKDQIALNVGFVAALLFIFNYLKTRDNLQLIVSAIAFGLVLGYKLVAPVYLAVTMIVAAFLIYTNHKDLLADKAARLALMKTCVIAAIITTAIGGYWYIRNILLYGRVLGALTENKPVDAASTGQDVQGSDYLSVLDFIKPGKFIGNIQDFFPRIFDYQSLYGADLAGMSGFGPQFVAFGLIGIAAAIATLFLKKYRTDVINIYAYSGILLLLVYFTLYYSSNNYRLFIFLPVIFILYSAILISKAGLLGNKRYAPLINVSILLIIGWNFVNILPPQYTDNRQLKEFISLDDEYRTAANFTWWFSAHHPSFYRLLKYIPASEPIAYVSQPHVNFPGEVADDTWTYLYYDRHWKRKVRYFAQDKYLDCGPDHVCTSRDGLKTDLLKNNIKLVSVCRTNRCLMLADPDFMELVPGFYYFSGKISE